MWENQTPKTTNGPPSLSRTLSLSRFLSLLRTTPLTIPRSLSLVDCRRGTRHARTATMASDRGGIMTPAPFPHIWEAGYSPPSNLPHRRPIFHFFPLFFLSQRRESPAAPLVLTATVQIQRPLIPTSSDRCSIEQGFRLGTSSPFPLSGIQLPHSLSLIDP